MKYARFMMFSLAVLAICTKDARAIEQEEATKEEAGSAQAALHKLEENKSEITTKEQQIAELEAKIKQLQSQRASVQSQAQATALQIERIKEELQKARLQLKQTQLSITATQEEVAQKEDELARNERAVGDLRQQLAAAVRLLYEHELKSDLHIFLSSGSLAELITERTVNEEIQERTVQLIQNLRERQTELKEQQAALAERQQELINLQQALHTQQSELKEDEQEKSNLVQQKLGQQAEYERLIAEARQAREETQSDVFRLKNVGVEISFSNASEAARFASKSTGVRAAVLLAVLKVETNVGEWIGSGHFPDDMHPANREAFLRVTKKLNLDPNTAPISRRPRSYTGWGGAMGPAQMMPLTWERIEQRVAQVMGKPLPNPYEMADALIATGIFLADRGATDRAREYEAVNRYLAGPNWIYHTWYGDRVLAVAKEYEKEGL